MTDDRSAILRRRAFFVTSAVAALGSCARHATPPSPAPEPTVSVPRAAPDAGDPESDAALPGASRDAAHATDLPPLDIPAGVSETARQKYERLISVMTRAHRMLDELEKDAPTCSILAPSCEPRFRRVAEGLHDLDALFQRFFTCGGSSAEAKAYAEREEAHQRHYQERRKRVEAQIDSALEAGGPLARARWDEHRRAAYEAAPFPCLKFACPEW